MIQNLFVQRLSNSEFTSDKRFTNRVFIAAIIAGVVGAIAFVINPQLDFVLMQMINRGEVFALSDNDTWSLIRRLVMVGFAIAYVIFVLGLFRSIYEKRAIWKIRPIAWLYLVVSSLVGPLLLTNVILKSYVGRPRPRNVTEYGGSLDFIPVFQSGGNCMDNCSFVSGEVSSMAMIFAGLMFACKPLRTLFLCLLLPAWAFASYLRIAAGAHFPSDSFFAGIFMIVIAAGLYRLLVLSPRNVEITD